jgi:hypothetical protein
MTASFRSQDFRLGWISGWMSILLIAGSIGLLIGLISCGAREQHATVPGPLTQAPPPPAHVSSATEVLITDHANAVATGNAPAAKATSVAITTQDTEEGIGDLRWLMLAGIVVTAVGAGAWKEFGSMIGGGIIAAGAALLTLATIWGPVYAHRGALCWAVILAGIGYEAWRHRAALEREAKQAEVQGAALAHAVLHIPVGTMVTHGVQAVETVLRKAVHTAEADAELLLVKLHLAKGVAATTPSAAPQPPNPAPSKPVPLVPATPPPIASPTAASTITAGT